VEKKRAMTYDTALVTGVTRQRCDLRRLFASKYSTAVVNHVSLM